MEHTFDASPEAIAQARKVLSAWLAGCDIHAEASDLTLVMGELCTNAVRHGKGPIRLLLAMRPGQVPIEVHDRGGGHPAIRPVQPVGPHAGGWGLRFVDHLVDTWGTSTTGDLTIVWVEHAITTPGRAAQRRTRPFDRPPAAPRR